MSEDDEEKAAAPELEQPVSPQPAEDALAAKDRQIDELTNTLKRIQAEFENYKKRRDKEYADRVKLAGEMVMTALLPVLDTFDKALEDAKNNGDAQKLRKGLESVHRQLMQALRGEGLKEIKTGDKFDPFMHEALMREEDENGEDGKILEVYQKGYTLGPKVIRTSKVKVSKKKEPEAASEEPQTTKDHDARESQDEKAQDQR
jgi:molecular chaperone GrpE